MLIKNDLAVFWPTEYNILNSMSTAEERLLAYRRTITIIAVIIILYLSFMIIKPFLVAIIGAAVLAYLFYPVYRFLAHHIPAPFPKESLSALLTVSLIVLIVLIPMASITALLTNEARSGYFYLQKMVSRPGFTFDLPPYLVERFGENVPQVREALVNVASQFVIWLQGVLKGIPAAFLGILVTIFSIYFFLKGGKEIYGFFQEFFPLPEGRYKEIFSRFHDLSRGMILGQVVVGIMHGVLAWGAYVFLGISNPVLWAFVTAIVSIIPVIGASMVWVPIGLYLIVTGLGVGTYWKGVALLIYGFGLMSTIDNVLKPKIIGDSARIHPLVILFGILGGIQLIGLPGILIGPLVLALFDVVMSIFREVI